MMKLPIESILAPGPKSADPPAEIIGRSRGGRPIRGYRVGSGSMHVSLIGGCHADEPVGPSMLRRLVRFLTGLEGSAPLIEAIRWSIVPDVNPDGAVRNSAWSDHPLEAPDHRGDLDRVYDPVLYVRHVVRELPGDDIEFGFPRHLQDRQARPENRAVARFLASGAPYVLHASLHGMGFAPGPWFLIEPGWIDRTLGMRDSLRQRVRTMGYPLFDVDRGGEKGFHRIDEGFCTRPDSGAMRDHFLARGEEEMAGRFRPSSMELVRDLGGDPLTLVSEMPLFLLSPSPAGAEGPAFQTGTEGKRHLHERLGRIVQETSNEEGRSEMTRLGIQPMPIRDQMRLQLAFLQEAINSVRVSAPWEPPR